MKEDGEVSAKTFNHPTNRSNQAILQISDDCVTPDIETFKVLKREHFSNSSARMEFDKTEDYSSDSSLSLGNDPTQDDNIRKINKRTSSGSVPVRNKRNNIWSAQLQEECLMENFRDCDVTNRKRERDVEYYDYTMKYRINGESSNK